MAPCKYIEKICDSFEQIFDRPSKKNGMSLMKKNDHLELDTSKLFNLDEIQLYESLIVALQWVVSIGKFDIKIAVMILSSFRVAPRCEHIKQLKPIYGYLAKMKNAVIRIRTGEPEFSSIPTNEFDAKSMTDVFTKVVIAATRKFL